MTKYFRNYLKLFARNKSELENFVQTFYNLNQPTANDNLMVPIMDNAGDAQKKKKNSMKNKLSVNIINKEGKKSVKWWILPFQKVIQSNQN